MSLPYQAYFYLSSQLESVIWFYQLNNFVSMLPVSENSQSKDSWNLSMDLEYNPVTRL